jgi:Leucine-rich repeat (LRR) protein
LGALKRCTLTANQLTSLPVSIGDLQALEELRLDINQLVEVPPSIGSLSNLRLLSAASNLLTWLPESIGLLDRLEDLDVHGNRLTALPESLGNLHSLTTLLAGRNMLAAVPSALWGLGRLAVLRLDDNEIKWLPPGPERLKGLTEFGLLGNRLALFSKETRHAINALRTHGCEVRFGPLPHRVIANVFGPTAFTSAEPDVAYCFDLDGRLCWRLAWMMARSNGILLFTSPPRTSPIWHKSAVDGGRWQKDADLLQSSRRACAQHLQV